MAVDNFGAVKIDIEATVEDRVNALVESELTVAGLSKMLGTLRAVTVVTRQIAATAKHAAHLETTRAAIESRPAASENERNQAREALAGLDAQQSALAARHEALTAHLETLHAALRA